MKLDDLILLRSDRRIEILGFNDSVVGKLFSRYKGVLVLMVLKKREIKKNLRRDERDNKFARILNGVM